MFDRLFPGLTSGVLSSPPTAVETPGSYGFAFEHVSTASVLKALKAIDPKKSSGPDGLDPYLLRLSAEVIAEPLANIFNLSLSTNLIPKSWKEAYVLPILKGGDPSDLNNYRPISKLSVVAKIMESLVNDQLKEFLSESGQLNSVQSGFRSGHSTITAASKVLNDIIQGLDNNKHCAAFDLSKAFDTVDHTILINRLHNIGLCVNSVRWFANYLTDGSQTVLADGQRSSPKSIARGVPQGSILGPILFTIYINNIGTDIHNSDMSNFHLYADDTIVYSCASSLSCAFQHLQKMFSSIQADFINLKLVLNSKKTQVMHFSRSHSQAPVPHIFTTDGKCLEQVSEVPESLA